MRDRLGHADHGPLDDIGRTSLEWCVDRGTLRETAARRIRVLDAGRVDLAPEDRHHEALLARALLRAVRIVADARIAREVGLDVFRGLALGNAELAREAEWADAVDDAEIDRFRL